MSRTDDWDKDIRDPVSFDPTLTVARFVSATDETHTIGTLVNWADHPEVAHFSEADSGDDHRALSATGCASRWSRA